MNRNFTRFAFTKSVKEAQERYGTRHAYARIERLVKLSIQAWDWNCPQHITPRYTVDEISETGLTQQ